MVNEKENGSSKSNENEDPKGNSEPFVTMPEDVQQTEKILVSGSTKTVEPADGIKPNPPPFKMVTREQWGAEKPKNLNPFRGPARNVRLIFTDCKPCRSKKTCIKVIKQLQRSQMRQGLSDIAYNFLIGGDIRVYEGRGWTEHPGMTEGVTDFRTCSDLIIAYVGTFDDNIDYPEMGDTAGHVIDYGYTYGYITGDKMSTGGQPPDGDFANTGIDIPGFNPQEIYKSAYGIF